MVGTLSASFCSTSGTIAKRNFISSSSSSWPLFSVFSVARFGIRAPRAAQEAKASLAVVVGRQVHPLLETQALEATAQVGQVEQSLRPLLRDPCPLRPIPLLLPPPLQLQLLLPQPLLLPPLRLRLRHQRAQVIFNAALPVATPVALATQIAKAVIQL